MKYTKRIFLYLFLSLFLSLFTVYYKFNTISDIILILECFIYYSLVIFINDKIICKIYFKTNLPSPLKILINISLGICLLLLFRFLFSKFAIYQTLTFDLFIIFLIPFLIILDVNLDYYIRKTYEKYNINLRKFINKKK